MKQFSFAITIFTVLVTSLSFARGRHVTNEPREIRKILKYHPELTHELLLVLAERPGTQMAQATVDYITVVRENPEREYSCELETTVTLTDGDSFYDKVEVEKLCEHIFN